MITSSDDFVLGGRPFYKHPDLEELVNAVDYISMHTYPFHNTIIILSFGYQIITLKINF